MRRFQDGGDRILLPVIQRHVRAEHPGDWSRDGSIVDAALTGCRA
jgi:hypothetical protein